MTKGEQTRKKIVAAAAPIFNRRGFEGSSLSDLMAATGLQKGGIYRHFSSKEELAAEAFDYTWSAARSTRLLTLSEKPPGIARLRQMIANFEDRPPVDGGCPVLNTAVDADDGNPLLRDRVRKALRSWKSSVRSMVADAIKQGEIPADTDPDDVTAIIIASLEGAIMMIRLERDLDALHRVQQHLYRYLDSLERPR